MCLTSPAAGSWSQMLHLTEHHWGLLWMVWLTGLDHSHTAKLPVSRQGYHSHAAVTMVVGNHPWVWTSHCLGIIWESGHRAVTHQGPSYSTRKWAPGLERSGSWSAMQKTAWLGCVLMDEPPLQWLRLRRFAKNKIKYPTGVPYPPSADNQTGLVWRRWFIPDYPLGKPLPCFLQLTAC